MLYGKGRIWGNVGTFFYDNSPNETPTEALSSLSATLRMNTQMYGISLPKLLKVASENVLEAVTPILIGYSNKYKTYSLGDKADFVEFLTLSK